MSISNTNLKVAQSAVVATDDSWIAEGSVNGNKNGTTVSIGRTATDKRKSGIHQFTISSYPNGKVVSATLRIFDIGGALPTAADACTVSRLRVTFVETSVTWTNIDKDVPTAWGTAGARNVTTDIFTLHQASFNLPTTNTDVDVDVTDMLQDALDAGDSTLGFVTEDDVSGAAANAWLSGNQAMSPAQLVNVVIIPEPYYTWIEAEEVIGRVHDTKADVILQLGSRSFGANDEVRVEYSSSDPTLATFAASTASGDFNATGEGQPYTVGDDPHATPSISGLTPDTRYWYRIAFSTAVGGPYDLKGVIRTFVTLPTPGTSGTNHTIVLLGDDHRLKTKIDADTNVLTVQDKTAENMAAELAEDGSLPAFFFHVGDHILTKAATNIYPLLGDGTGTPNSPTHGYALSQADANEAARFYRNHVEWPMHSMVPIMARGNHEAGHNFHYDANNGAIVNDTATWTLNALFERFGLPSALPTSPTTGDCYWTSAEAQTLGQYYAFELGDTLVCVMDDYLHSVLSGSIPDPLPNTYDAISDWSLGTEQFDFFFHLTTGVIATRGKKNVILLHHNKVGGRVSNPVGGNHYGRGGAQYARQDLETEGVDYTTGLAADRSEWMLVVHPRLAELRASYGVNILDIEGHDHIHQFVKTVDGIAYIHTAQPGGSGGSNDPYGDGFVSVGRFNSSPFTWKPNAGHYVIDATATSMVVKAKRTYVAGLGVTDPSDGVITNGAVIEEMTIRSNVGAISSPPPGMVHNLLSRNRAR